MIETVNGTPFMPAYPAGTVAWIRTTKEGDGYVHHFAYNPGGWTAGDIEDCRRNAMLGDILRGHQEELEDLLRRARANSRIRLAIADVATLAIVVTVVAMMAISLLWN